jgi:hypothetical protein
MEVPSLELHGHRLLCHIIIRKIKIFLLSEVEHIRNYIAWERCRRNIEIADITVVETTCCLNFVLRVGELCLKRKAFFWPLWIIIIFRR